MDSGPAHRSQKPLTEGGPEVSHALRRERVRVDGGVKGLDGNPSVVAALDVFGGDGGEVDLAHAGAAEVGVVGVEVGGPKEGSAADLRDGAGVGGHGFHIEMEADVRRVDFFQEGDGLGGGVEEVRFGRAEKLEGDGDARRCEVRGEALEEIDGARLGVRARLGGMEGALLRAAPDHDTATHDGAELGEVAGVSEGAGVDCGVGIGEVVDRLPKVRSFKRC